MTAQRKDVVDGRFLPGPLDRLLFSCRDPGERREPRQRAKFAKRERTLPLLLGVHGIVTGSRLLSPEWSVSASARVSSSAMLTRAMSSRMCIRFLSGGWVERRSAQKPSVSSSAVACGFTMQSISKPLPMKPGAAPAPGEQVQRLGKGDGVPGHAHRGGVSAVLPLARNEQVQQIAQLEQDPGEEESRVRQRTGPGRYCCSFLQGRGIGAEEARRNRGLEAVAGEDMVRLVGDHGLELGPGQPREQPLGDADGGLSLEVGNGQGIHGERRDDEALDRPLVARLPHAFPP